MIKFIRGKPYVYVGQRVGGRVVTRYVGPWVEDVDGLDAAALAAWRDFSALRDRPRKPSGQIRIIVRALTTQRRARLARAARETQAPLDAKRRQREQAAALRAEVEALDAARAPLDAAARAAEVEALHEARGVWHNRSWRVRLHDDDKQHRTQNESDATAGAAEDDASGARSRRRIGEARGEAGEARG